MSVDSYKASICKLKLAPIPGAVTLQLAYVNGLTYAVGKDYTEDKLYLIFGPDGQISDEYARANDLIRRRDLETGKMEGGFFDENRKVRSIKLMKGTVYSSGFIAPLDSLAFTKGNISKLKEGTELSEFNGVPICNKFINEATRKAMGSKNQVKQKKNYTKLIGFAEHQDTNQFFKCLHLIEPEDVLIVGEKLDGTSVRIGNPFYIKRKNFFTKLLLKFLDISSTYNKPS